MDLGPALDDPVAAEEGVDAFAVRVDLDFLRSAPRRVELPTPDGRVLAAELSVFEDRGNGDFMWAGGSPDAGYESVVLTVRGGRFAGRFGEPGGAKFRITAGPTGSGRLVDTAQLGRDRERVRCPGGIVPEDDGFQPAVAASSEGAPQSVTGESNHDFLDILVLYTARAKEVWTLDNLQTPEDDATTPEAATQVAIDYLNMVFRNNELDLNARAVHVAEAPPSLNESLNCSGLLYRTAINQEVRDLRAEHKADLVHIFAAREAAGCCGIAYLLQRGGTARNFWFSAYGMTKMHGCDMEETFAHEIGHNLGAHHDPPNAGEDFDETRQNTVTPYSFGHTWFSPSSPNPPDIDTIMSYGIGRTEPWFSTVREKPMGWTLGIAGERENERALQGTVGIAVQYSDFVTRGSEPPPPPPPPRPIAPSNVTGVGTSPTSVRLSWIDGSDNETGFEVQYRPEGARWTTSERVAANTVSANVTDLEPGGRYDFRVRAFNRNGASNSNIVTVVLADLEYTDCVPRVPQITFDHGDDHRYTVSMCIEYLDKGVGPIVKADAEDYELDSRESGLLYFFDRDNAEVLIKVLDACAINGHRWVFVAPVTTLAFNLYVDETATGKRWPHRNPKGDVTATTKSDLTAFPCDGSASSTSVAGGGDGVRGVELVDAGLAATWDVAVSLTPPVLPAVVSAPISGGEGTDCVPQPVPGLSLRGGYTVKMCVEYLKDGEPTVVGAENYGLDSEQSAILYFFDRNNAEVLIKVLDGCRVNGHRWVFVAPVTSLAFNIAVESPDGEEVWRHDNRLNQTAAAKSDITAFACSGSS